MKNNYVKFIVIMFSGIVMLYGQKASPIKLARSSDIKNLWHTTNTFDYYHAPDSMKKFITKDSVGLNVLEGYSFVYDGRDQLLNLLFNKPISSQIYQTENLVLIRNCTFNDIAKTYFYSSPSFVFKNGIRIDSCRFNPSSFNSDPILIVNNIKGDVSFRRNELFKLQMSCIKNSVINVEENHFKDNYIFFLNLENANLYCGSNTFDKDIIVGIDNSSLYNFNFSEKATHTIDLQFSYDTLTGPIAINKTENTPTGQIFVEFDYGCYIDGPIRFVNVKRAAFTGCTFGPNAKLVGSVDFIIINDCQIREQLDIDVYPNYAKQCKTKRTILNCLNSDIQKMNFNYLGNIKLSYDKLYMADIRGGKVSNESINENYENLLAKYKTENKTESFKKLHVEYFIHKHSWFRCVVNDVFWYYGFQRWRILIWTGVLWITFFIINTRKKWWKQIYETYPAIDIAPVNFHQTIHNRKSLIARRIMEGITYTSYIFFTLRIDFSKLCLKHPGWVAYFFIQYLSGLACLFLIINFILTL